MLLFDVKASLLFQIKRGVLLEELLLPGVLVSVMRNDFILLVLPDAEGAFEIMHVDCLLIRILD